MLGSSNFSTAISETQFFRWFHYDSDSGKEFPINMVLKVPWMMKVSYLYFDLDGITWEDPTAYLCFDTGDIFAQSVITQGISNKSEIMFPIKDPMGSPSVDACACGIPNSDTFILEPFLRDRAQNKIPFRRLVITFYIKNRE